MNADLVGLADRLAKRAKRANFESGGTVPASYLVTIATELRALAGAEVGGLSALNGTRYLTTDGFEIRFHLNVGINTWKDGKWCGFDEASPEDAAEALRVCGATLIEEPLPPPPGSGRGGGGVG